MSIENAYLDYVQPQTAGGELSQLSALAEQQAAAAAKVADLEAQLNKAREELRDIAERQVPELMDQIGIGEFKTTSGLKIKIDETIRASIPKAKAPLAFAWLKNNGHGSLIKRVVSVAFGKGEDERAEELRQQLSVQFEVDDNASVHPSTLAAFVREKLRNGEEVPLDLFGVHRQRVSKIET
ncbi:MAG: hypothetical protein WC132_06450 [Methanomethylophilus sp.]